MFGSCIIQAAETKPLIRLRIYTNAGIATIFRIYGKAGFLTAPLKWKWNGWMKINWSSKMIVSTEIDFCNSVSDSPPISYVNLPFMYVGLHFYLVKKVYSNVVQHCTSQDHPTCFSRSEPHLRIEAAKAALHLPIIVKSNLVYSYYGNLIITFMINLSLSEPWWHINLWNKKGDYGPVRLYTTMLYNVHVYTRGINVGVLIYVACIIYLDDSQREESVQGSSLAVTLFITKTGLYNFDPLKPHFYMVKLGFKGVNIIFLILL